MYVNIQLVCEFDMLLLKSIFYYTDKTNSKVTSSEIKNYIKNNLHLIDKDNITKQYYARRLDVLTQQKLIFKKRSNEYSIAVNKDLIYPLYTFVNSYFEIKNIINKNGCEYVK